MNIVRSRRSFQGLGDVVEDPSGNAGFLPSDYTVIDSSGQAVMTDANGNPIPILDDPNAMIPIATVQPPGGATVPKPPTAGPSYTFNVTPASSSLTPGLPPGPAPRVAVPTSITSSLSSLFSSPTGGIPTGLLLLGAAVGVALMMAPTGRRR